MTLRFRNATLRSPRSIPPMYVRSSPHFVANDSCERPAFFRSSRTRRPNFWIMSGSTRDRLRWVMTVRPRTIGITAGGVDGVRLLLSSATSKNLRRALLESSGTHQILSPEPSVRHVGRTLQVGVPPPLVHVTDAATEPRLAIRGVAEVNTTRKAGLSVVRERINS